MEHQHSVPYYKMNGLGNDFVIVDGRGGHVSLCADGARALADRKGGLGCDQVILLKPSTQGDVFMDIYNADGSRSGACGNASRCVAQLVMDERQEPACTLETAVGILKARRVGDLIAVDMGRASFEWHQIPLKEAVADVLHLPFVHENILSASAVSVGNPHLVCRVGETTDALVHELGPLWTHHDVFPEGVNVGFAQVLSPTHVRLKVWERGTGQTLACGTGACAAAAVLYRLGHVQSPVALEMDGGTLEIYLSPDLDMTMVGPAVLEHQGEVRLP